MNISGRDTFHPCLKILKSLMNYINHRLYCHRQIQEFQQALVQRDQVIEQLTQNVQLIAQSRDAVQAEATEQTNQLTQYIQALQNQLKEVSHCLPVSTK